MSTKIEEMDEIEVEESSGNVFADLGLPDPEERLGKAILSRQIDKLIEARELTQRQAAELLGITQPDVSNIVRGRLSGFSLERLTRFLTLLGQDVEITVRPTGEGGAHGHLLVRVA